MSKWDESTLFILPLKCVCIECKNYINHLTCTAFPDGIPDEIVFNGMPHDLPLPDQDNEIVFEQK